MSDYNTPIKLRQGGTVLEVASGGTINVLAGGSIQNAGAMTVTTLTATTLAATNPVSIGGTAAKWAYGTLGLASGVGTLGVPGFTRVFSVNANAILGEAPGLGSASSVHIDLSLSGAGSVIFRAVAGTLPYTGNNATIAWQALGT